MDFTEMADEQVFSHTYDDSTIIRIVVIGLKIYLFPVMKLQPLNNSFVSVTMQEVGVMAFSASDEVN